MDKKNFFDEVRKKPFNGRLTQSQVEGMEYILDVWQTEYADKITVPQMAYILATTFHETDATMQPIEEYGKGRRRRYGRPHPQTGQVYYGRGYVQLTWYMNYLRAQNALGIDFVDNPDEVMVHANAAKIMFEGMLGGWFTGRALANYISGERKDYYGARKIINGLDRAALISRLAEDFEEALQE